MKCLVVSIVITCVNKQKFSQKTARLVARSCCIALQTFRPEGRELSS